MSAEQVDNLYWTRMDADAPNNSHSFTLQLVGHGKRVMELGPAAGHFTRLLVDNGCEVVGVEIDPAAAAGLEGLAHRVVVGDLADPGTVDAAIEDGLFDVVVGGDVLEHLADPLAVLLSCRRSLKPGGYMVLSLPNIAHADVKLQLLNGRFPYRDLGLLDRTHLHFFTLSSVEELLRDAGLLLVDLKRVTLPVFTTEQAVDRDSVPADLLAHVLADPESETYQFVVRALLHDGDSEKERLAARCVDLQGEVERERARRVVAESERDAALAEIPGLQQGLAEAVERAQGFELLSQEHEAHIEALRSTRSYRMLAPVRAFFGRRA